MTERSRFRRYMFWVWFVCETLQMKYLLDRYLGKVRKRDRAEEFQGDNGSRRVDRSRRKSVGAKGRLVMRPRHSSISGRREQTCKGNWEGEAPVIGEKSEGWTQEIHEKRVFQRELDGQGINTGEVKLWGKLTYSCWVSFKYGHWGLMESSFRGFGECK